MTSVLFRMRPARRVLPFARACSVRSVHIPAQISPNGAVAYMPALVSHHITPKKTRTKKQPREQPYLTSLSALRRYLALEKNEDSDQPLSDPVFIAVDLEAFEFDQKKITEVGIAILDSRHLPSPSDAPHVSTWLEKIKSHHYIIKETRKLVNKKYVEGCPDNFNFGKSKILRLDSIRDVLMKIVKSASSSEKNPRPVVLVGHDIGGDIRYLSTLKYQVPKSPLITNLLDVQKVADSLDLPIGLVKLLLALDQKPIFLHNAGNDATYTMHAMLLMALYNHVFPEPASMEIARFDITARKQKELAFRESARKLRQEKKQAEEAEGQKSEQPAEFRGDGAIQETAAFMDDEAIEGLKRDVRSRGRDGLAMGRNAQFRKRDRIDREWKAIARKRDAQIQERRGLRASELARMVEDVEDVKETEVPRGVSRTVDKLLKKAQKTGRRKQAIADQKAELGQLPKGSE